jgi:hypothetical protein
MSDGEQVTPRPRLVRQYGSSRRLERTRSLIRMDRAVHGQRRSEALERLLGATITAQSSRAIRIVSEQRNVTPSSILDTVMSRNKEIRKLLPSQSLVPSTPLLSIGVNDHAICIMEQGVHYVRYQVISERAVVATLACTTNLHTVLQSLVADYVGRYRTRTIIGRF